MLALRDVPIVAVSAGNTEYSRVKAHEAGFNDYLVKPFGVAELREVLDRLPPAKGSQVH
jgi:DNA-binding response OmpR family regulator